jgi:predicted MFS family arabinose efflux permease
MRKIAGVYKNAYSGFSTSTWWLCFVMFVNRCGTMVVPFMTLYLTQYHHYSISKAGLVMAIFGAGAVCGGFLGGRLTDKFGFYTIQLVALTGGGIMFITLGYANSFPLICILTFFLSLINDSFRPANATAIAHYSTEDNRVRAYSLNRLATNLGWAFGGALGGFVASKNYHLLFWIDGITNILAAILLRIILKPAPKKTKEQKQEQKNNPPHRSPYKDGAYITFILLTTVFAYSFFQLFTTIPVFFKKELHLPETYIGAIMALNGILIVAFEMVTVFKIEGRRKNLVFVFYGTLLMGLSYVVFNIVPGELSLAILSTLIVTIAEILTLPFMNSFWISRSGEHNRGQYAGLYTVAWSIAQIAGPATGTLLVDAYGFRTLWWTIGVFSLLTAVGYRLLSVYVDKE